MTYHRGIVSKVRITVGVGHGVRRHRLTILHPNLGGFGNTGTTTRHTAARVHTLTRARYMQCNAARTGSGTVRALPQLARNGMASRYRSAPSPARLRPKASRVTANQTARYQTDISVIRSARCVYIVFIRAIKTIEFARHRFVIDSETRHCLHSPLSLD